MYTRQARETRMHWHASMLDFGKPLEENDMPSMHDFQMTSIDGEDVALSQYEGKVCLVVNVASK